MLKSTPKFETLTEVERFNLQYRSQPAYKSHVSCDQLGSYIRVQLYMYVYCLVFQGWNNCLLLSLHSVIGAIHVIIYRMYALTLTNLAYWIDLLHGIICKEFSPFSHTVFFVSSFFTIYFLMLQFYNSIYVV